MNLTITGNTIANPVPATETCPTKGGPEGALWGLVFTSGAQTGDTNTTCANISGNSMAGSSPSAADGGIDDFELDEWGNGIYRLPGYTGGSADSNAVVSYIQGRNTGDGTPSGRHLHQRHRPERRLLLQHHELPDAVDVGQRNQAPPSSWGGASCPTPS